MPKYINAEIAENYLRQYAENKHSDGEIELANGILKAVCRLKTIPTADVKEVVRGKWIFKNGGTYNRLRAYCSECGLHSGIGGIRKNQIKPFCPNCGADMREVAQE